MFNKNELKIRIIKKSDELFQKFGFTKVTMDEIAQSMGISKKTIYKFFNGKKELIFSILDYRKSEVSNYVKDLMKKTDLDFISKLKNLMNFIGTLTARLNSPMVNDLQKNYPDVWDELMEHRRQHTLKEFGGLIQEGIKEGIFRKDIDQQLIVLIYVNSMHQMLNPETLANIPFTAPQVFDAVITMIFEGIMTEEGRNKYCTLEKNEDGE